MTGSPPKYMTFAFNAPNPKAGVILHIPYPSASSRGIEVSGNRVEFNAWNATLQPPNYGEITGDKGFCGESRYTAVTNIFSFYISSGCVLKIKPRDAIQAKVRMEWTLDAFFADGGTTTFTDRLAASLGIHASSIKVVSVYEGSVIVDYEISPVEVTGFATLTSE